MHRSPRRHSGCSPPCRCSAPPYYYSPGTAATGGVTCSAASRRSRRSCSWRWCSSSDARPRHRRPHAAPSTCSSGCPSTGCRSTSDSELDQLSMCFVLLITGVGSLIHIYSVGYMAHDAERRKFFAYLNLFLAAMLLLVLADNFLGLYLGWEGVGSRVVPADRFLAVQALRGDGREEGVRGQPRRRHRTARRADDHVRHLRLASLRHGVRRRVRRKRRVLTALGLMLLLAACAKSAQVPLQSWLGDAMEGPTPVSALIHAATMVTAGVYLIVRSNPIFDLAPDAQLAVVIVGAVRCCSARSSAARRTTSRKHSPRRR